MKLEENILNPKDVKHSLDTNGFCIVPPDILIQLSGTTQETLNDFSKYWDDLVKDQYLKDLGGYRFRRHSSYTIEGGNIELNTHRAHWQSKDYNALHGGIVRLFEPISADLNHSNKWLSFICSVTSLIGSPVHGNRWYVEAHQFRILTLGGIGRPTPEGAHRDGVDFVAVIMVKRHFISGGETRIFETEGQQGLRFTLDQPWSLLLLNDHRLIHESTPIQDLGGDGHRDTLVLTFRSLGFQNPD